MRAREAQMIPVCGDTGVKQVLHSVTFCGSDDVLDGLAIHLLREPPQTTTAAGQVKS